ncbi:MAG: homoserine O-succinyltransferase [Pseudoxanthomonas suwonensis]|nr:homoserine O-succinyltransferase [Pseudoxanthomonas suwonensis]
MLHATTDAAPARAGVPPGTADADALPDAQRGEVCLRLSMAHAGERDVLLRWQRVGAVDAPQLLLAGGISAGRHALANRIDPAPGWWQGQASSFDTDRFGLLSFDWIGADGELDVPIDSADQADALAALLDALQVPCLHAFVGSSYGAMAGLQLAARHPARVSRLVAISGAHRAHPFASAWRALQRRAVALGAVQCDTADGLALARAMAMLSYRTPEEFAQRFDAEPVLAGGRVRCAAEDYLDAVSSRWVARTPAVAFLRLSESIDLHRVDPARVRVPTTVVAVDSDRLVPAEDSRALFDALPCAAGWHALSSHYGHDAFLKEPAAIDAVLRDVLHSTC